MSGPYTDKPECGADRAPTSERRRGWPRSSETEVPHVLVGQFDADPLRPIQPLVGWCDRTHLDRPPARGRNPGRHLQSLVEVRALDDVIAGQDLLGHREGADGDLC